MSLKKQMIREAFRKQVFKRDRYRCRICNHGVHSELDAHHIVDRNEMPGGGYVPENGITLCYVHHNMAEAYHRSGGEEWHDGMHPDDLYELIDSSHVDAILASQKKLV